MTNTNPHPPVKANYSTCGNKCSSPVPDSTAKKGNWPARYPDYLKTNNQGINHERMELANAFINDCFTGVMDEGMRTFYETHGTDGKVLEDLPDGVFASTLLEPQETTSPIELKGTYRGQFMQGKESEYKATVDALVKMCTNSGGSRIHALDNCRRFAYFARDKISGDVRVMTDSCRQRWCPMCAGQKAKYAKESTQRYIESLDQPRFLTLTLRNKPGDLLPQIQFLQDCFKRLRQRAYWKRNVKGGIWFMQVKRGKDSGQWHPHFHILLDGNYMERERLSALWDLVTYGSPIIDIRTIRDSADAAGYVARYSARPAYLDDMPIDDRIQVISALHGKRLSGTFGNAKSVTLTPPKIESDAEWEHLGYYNKVVDDSSNNKCAMAILQAWKNDTALAEVDYKAYTAKPYEIKTEHPVTRKPIQYTLDFFNTG